MIDKPKNLSSNSLTNIEELNNMLCMVGLNGLKLKTEKSNTLFSDLHLTHLQLPEISNTQEIEYWPPS